MAKILVVDDRPINREFLVSLLTHFGHEVPEASNGADALTHVGRDRPDLIITDIQMPTMDGREFLARLRADPGLASIPVILYTASYKVPEARAIGRSAGAAAVLGKPTSPETVLAAVDAALGLPAPSGLFFSPASPYPGGEATADSHPALSLPAHRLAALVEMPLDLHTQQQPEKLFERFCHMGQDLTNAEIAVTLVGQGQQRMQTFKVDSAGESSPLARDPLLAEHILQAVQGKQLPFRSPRAGPLSARAILGAESLVTSFLVVPIYTLTQEYGWLELINKGGGDEFSLEDERLAVTLSMYAAEAHENLSLQDQLRRQAAALASADAREIALRTRVDEARAHLAAIVESCEDAIIGKRLDGTIVSWNRGAERLYGYQAQEVIGRSVSLLLPPDRPDELPAILERIGLGETVEHYETQRMRKDGTLVEVSLAISPFKDTAGGIIGASSIARDITHRKQAEDQIKELNATLERRVAERTTELVAANRELETFSYSVAHDLRAPLRGIDGFSLALVEDYGPKLDAEAQKYLGRIRAAAVRMGQLIDDLLGLSRISRTELHQEKVDVSALAQVLASDLQKSEPERPAEFVIPSGLEAEGDPRLLRVVLENLLGNAWKFSAGQQPTRIELGLSDSDGRKAYFVRDNGAGFDMAYAGKLFVPFQRLHGGAEFPGTGIGLATVHRIVRKHGGEVWAEGAVGQGATVYFTLGGKAVVESS
jgi:PAS domain S-box-containing protein